ncbi:hypothetical protein [uncultured Kordia sp.]|uniref:hypothetical protein n=1 Tax=uncultured Kordia sp. TaxID=507699 RepID=UPI0026291145|nr:hypothetical protein [uncultured Kordia sp.]
MKFLQKCIYCFTVLLIVGCFSKTQNEKNLSNERNIFEPIGNVYFNDLLKKSAEAKKPLLFYFSYYSCTSCRELEDMITNDQKLFSSFQNDYIMVPLYTTNRETLPKKEWFYSNILGREVKTIGDKYFHWEMEKFETNALPLFAIVNEKGEKVKTLIYTRDLSEFHEFFLTSE